MIDPERLKLEFLTLAGIDSPSTRERDLAQHLISVFEALGGECFFDHSAVYSRSNTGNLIVRITGRSDLEPLLLSAHLDTVEPTPEVQPVEEAGIIRNEKGGLVGADDKSGIAVIIELVRALRDSGASHPPLELVFTTCEEIGLFGARYLDYRLLRAKMGYILDSEDPRKVIVKAPEAIKFRLKVLGRAAHTGLEPEKGLSAIKLAAEALARLPNGRIDEETTLNFGTIKGGKATNIVPEEVLIEGEIRSHDTAKIDSLWERINETFREVCSPPEPDGRPAFSAHREEMFPRFSVDPEHPVLRLLSRAASRLRMDLEYAKSEGGSDANIFNRNGITCVILGTGMRRVHSPEEYLVVEDMVLCTKLLYEVVVSAGEGALQPD